MSNDRRYNSLNDVEVESVILSSDQGGSVDIMHKVKHISIFEDMYSPFMSGYLRVVDAHNLINHFPIVGQETVEIKFKTPGFNKDFTTLSMDLHGIDGRTKSNDFKSEIFDLKLISKGFRQSKTRKISKAMTGRISDMISEIASEYLSGSSTTILKTKGDYKFVIPNWEPLRTIEWLAERSLSDSSPHNANYMFFERQDGYFFMPMGEMTKVSPKYAYDIVPTAISPNAETSGNVYKQFYNIQDLKIPKSFDRLEELCDSMYSSNLIVHDIVDKDYTVTANTYIKSFEDSSHCEKFPYLPIENRYSSNPSAISYVSTRHTGLHDDYPEGQDSEEWLLKRKSTLKSFDTNKIKMVVAGNSSLKVGDMVRVRIPSSEPVKKNDAEWYDKNISGKYLITGVRHQIDIMGSNPEYKTVVEASRDSVPRRTPDTSTFTVGDGS